MNYARFKSKLMPGILRRRQRVNRDRRVEREFAGLSNKEIFEKIYDEKRWGSPSGERRYSSGDGTRDEEIVDAYVESIHRFLESKPGPMSALDLGCGDFTIGSRLLPLFNRFTAVDVANNVIVENRKLFRAKNLKFKNLNITENNLPFADVIFVRQVLQHLSNSEIQKFLNNVQNKFRYLVVTESLSKSVFFTPNKDMQSGPGIRIHNRSGVVIESEPFNFWSKNIDVVLEYSKGKELLVTKAYF